MHFQQIMMFYPKRNQTAVEFKEIFQIFVLLLFSKNVILSTNMDKPTAYKLGVRQTWHVILHNSSIFHVSVGGY